MRALAAVCAALALLTARPIAAAQLSVPPIPHYEFLTPSLPQAAVRPRYTEPYDQGPPKGNTEDRKNDHWKSRWERITGDPVAFVTLCLAAIAGVQAGLFVWQLILIQSSLKDAKIAATAARESAQGTLETVRVLRNAQRPYLSPFNPELRKYDEAIRYEDASLVMISVQLDITNVGPGVGFILSYCIIHEICTRDSQGKARLRVNDYIGRLPIYPKEKWEAGDATFHSFRISNAEREAILNKTKVLYIWGHVRYSDLFQISRLTGFVFECIPETGILVMSPHNLWYDIEEEAKV